MNCKKCGKEMDREEIRHGDKVLTSNNICGNVKCVDGAFGSIPSTYVAEKEVRVKIKP